MAKIIKASDPVVVDRIVALIYGQPSTGKSTLAFTAEAPLLLDFDHGAHRTKQWRKDSLPIGTWQDAMEILDDAESLAEYKTVIVDTLSTCHSQIAQYIARMTPKLANRNGTLSRNGYGELGSIFRMWANKLKLLGKDVIVIAQQTEKDEGDKRVMRPKGMGKSGDDVIEWCELVGYMQWYNERRTIDFNPTDAYYAKTPFERGRIEIPHFSTNDHFLADILKEAKETLSTNAQSADQVAGVVADWQAKIAEAENASDLNVLLPDLAGLKGTVKVQVRSLVQARVKELGLTLDKSVGAYVDPEPATAE